MRTEMGPKIVSSSILMRTEGPNFGRRFDPFWVRKWPVGTEVRSHFRTFIAVDLNLKISPTKILPLIIALITLDAYSFSAFEASRLWSNELYEAVKALHRKGVRSGTVGFAQAAAIDVGAPESDSEEEEENKPALS